MKALLFLPEVSNEKLMLQECALLVSGLISRALVQGKGEWTDTQELCDTSRFFPEKPALGAVLSQGYHDPCSSHQRRNEDSL